MYLPQMFFFFIYIALATTNAKPQDFSDPIFNPNPAGVCGTVYLYQNNLKGKLRDDEICYQMTGDMKNIKVHKGCVCAAWSADLCGSADPMNGIHFYEIAREGEKSKSFKQADRVRWYKCGRV